MSQGASHYSISQLIARIISESELRRSEFVQAIEYKNKAKGLRRLDEWLEDGSGDEGFLEKIIEVFHPDPGELEAALAETEAIHEREHQEAVREIEERERRRFKPVIWVHTQDGAHSFFSALGERRIKVLWLADGFERLSEPEKLANVQCRVREHCRKTDGTLVGFGSILRYTYASTFDSSIIADVQGNVIEKRGGRFLLPEVWMELHR